MFQKFSLISGLSQSNIVTATKGINNKTAPFISLTIQHLFREVFDQLCTSAFEKINASQKEVDVDDQLSLGTQVQGPSQSETVR